MGCNQSVGVVTNVALHKSSFLVIEIGTTVVGKKVGVVRVTDLAFWAARLES
jgi:hypothetical protein